MVRGSRPFITCTLSLTQVGVVSITTQRQFRTYLSIYTFCLIRDCLKRLSTWLPRLTDTPSPYPIFTRFLLRAVRAFVSILLPFVSLLPCMGAGHVSLPPVLWLKGYGVSSRKGLGWKTSLLSYLPLLEVGEGWGGIVIASPLREWIALLLCVTLRSYDTHLNKIVNLHNLQMVRFVSKCRYAWKIFALHM